MLRQGLMRELPKLPCSEQKGNPLIFKLLNLLLLPEITAICLERDRRHSESSLSRFGSNSRYFSFISRDLFYGP